MGNGVGKKGNVWEEYPNQNAQTFALQVTLRPHCPQDAQRVAGGGASLSLLFPPRQHFCLSLSVSVSSSCHRPWLPVSHGGPPSSALCTGGCVASQGHRRCRGRAARPAPMGLYECFAPGWAAWERHCACLGCGVRSAARPRAWGKAGLAGCAG